MAEHTELPVEYQQILEQLRHYPENKKCCDCYEQMPGYACMDFANFICYRCAAIHREFEHKVSKISNYNLSINDVQMLKAYGNKGVTDKWMVRWISSDYPEPDGAADDNHRREFIRKKYIEKRWARADANKIAAQEVKEIERRTRASSSPAAVAPVPSSFTQSNIVIHPSSFSQTQQPYYYQQNAMSQPLSPSSMGQPLFGDGMGYQQNYNNGAQANPFQPTSQQNNMNGMNSQQNFAGTASMPVFQQNFQQQTTQQSNSASLPLSFQQPNFVQQQSQTPAPLLQQSSFQQALIPQQPTFPAQQNFAPQQQSQQQHPGLLADFQMSQAPDLPLSSPRNPFDAPAPVAQQNYVQTQQNYQQQNQVQAQSYPQISQASYQNQPQIPQQNYQQQQPYDAPLISPRNQQQQPYDAPLISPRNPQASQQSYQQDYQQDYQQPQQYDLGLTSPRNPFEAPIANEVVPYVAETTTGRPRSSSTPVAEGAVSTRSGRIKMVACPQCGKQMDSRELGRHRFSTCPYKQQQQQQY